MRLLITNDDGIDAEGMLVLANTLAQKHEVWKVVPDKNRSAVSHGITMYEPLIIRKLSDKYYSCSGVPVDCTFNGLRSLVVGKVDAVVSGINKGANLGTDLIYSGTAAAARQASFFGVPGIAVSLVSIDDVWNYQPLADFISDNLSNLLEYCDRNIFLNINGLSSSSYLGWKKTIPSIRKYNDTVDIVELNKDTYRSSFIGGEIETEERSNSDFSTVMEGYVSVSRINSQPSSVWGE